MERNTLPVEDTVQFRSLAQVALQSEEAAYKQQRAPKMQKKSSSWVGWLMGSQEEGDEVPSHVLDFGTEIQLSDAQRATLAALMSRAEEAMGSTDASPQARHGNGPQRPCAASLRVLAAASRLPCVLACGRRRRRQSTWSTS